MSLVEAYAGEIRLFAGAYAPRGWAFCDGQLLSIEENLVLFSLIGTTYGGDGIRTFALPDLRGRATIHRAHNGISLGQRGGGEEVAEGSDVQTTATLAINFIICLRGVFPDRS